MGQGLHWEPALGSKLRPRVISLLCDCSEVPEPRVPNRNLPEQLWEVLTGQSPDAVHRWALCLDTITPSHSIPGLQDVWREAVTTAERQETLFFIAQGSTDICSFPCLLAEMGKLSSKSEVSGSPWGWGKRLQQNCWAGLLPGGALPGVPERDGAQTQGRARVRQPRGGGHPLRMPGEGRVGRGGRGDWRFFGNKNAIYINYRRRGEKVKEVIVRIPNALIYKLCDHHSWVEQLLAISSLFSPQDKIHAEAKRCFSSEWYFASRVKIELWHNKFLRSQESFQPEIWKKPPFPAQLGRALSVSGSRTRLPSVHICSQCRAGMQTIVCWKCVG